MRRIALLAAFAAVCACNRKVAGGEADGAKIFAEVCARCHGEHGVPDPVMAAQLGVKDLTDPGLWGRLGEGGVERQVREGSQNGKMPAFGSVLTAEQAAAVAEFVKGLGEGEQETGDRRQETGDRR